MLLGNSAPADASPVTFETIPKPGGDRLLARLRGPLAIEYRDVVAPVAGPIEAALSGAVCAERAIVACRHAGPRLVMQDVRIAREGVRRRVAALSRMRPGPVVLGDVRACYASITPAVVERCVGRLDRMEDAFRVRAVLERLQDLGVDGLPVGPRASAILANAVLAEVDEEIEAAGALHVRWVDDLAIFVGDLDPRAVLRRLEETLDRLGLRLAEEKCAIGDLTATRFGRSLVRRRSARRADLTASLG